MADNRAGQGYASAIPNEMHLLFENGLYLSAFRTREAAERTKEGREKANSTRTLEVVTYWRKT